jgi:hypothetical protein
VGRAHQLAGARGAARKHHQPEPDDLEYQLYLERVRKIAESRPPLTPEQATKLSALFGPLRKIVPDD